MSSEKLTKRCENAGSVSYLKFGVRASSRVNLNLAPCTLMQTAGQKVFDLLHLILSSSVLRLIFLSGHTVLSVADLHCYRR
jgi:hypothetical protein